MANSNKKTKLKQNPEKSTHQLKKAHMDNVSGGLKFVNSQVIRQNHTKPGPPRWACGRCGKVLSNFIEHEQLVTTCDGRQHL